MSKDLELPHTIEGQRRLPTRRKFLRGSGAVAAAGVATLATRGRLGGDAEGATVTATHTAAASTRDARHAVQPLQQTAQNAVIFGVPAVLQSRYLTASDQAGIERNQFSVNLTLSTPATHVAGPNDDTLYGLTWLDLTEGPQVIEVPATHGRYYSIQLIDMWSNAFAYIGLHATGDEAGAYAITPRSGGLGGCPPGSRRSSHRPSASLPWSAPSSRTRRICTRRRRSTPVTPPGRCPGIRTSESGRGSSPTRQR